MASWTHSVTAAGHRLHSSTKRPIVRPGRCHGSAASKARSAPSAAPRTPSASDPASERNSSTAPILLSVARLAPADTIRGGMDLQRAAQHPHCKVPSAKSRAPPVAARQERPVQPYHTSHATVRSTTAEREQPTVFNSSTSTGSASQPQIVTWLSAVVAHNQREYDRNECRNKTTHRALPSSSAPQPRAPVPMHGTTTQRTNIKAPGEHEQYLYRHGRARTQQVDQHRNRPGMRNRKLVVDWRTARVTSANALNQHCEPTIHGQICESARSLTLRVHATVSHQTAPSGTKHNPLHSNLDSDVMGPQQLDKRCDASGPRNENLIFRYLRT